MLTWNVTYHCKPGKREEFFKAISDLGVRACSIPETGNLKYDYFTPFDDPETVLLIDSWADQSAIDVHHASPMMQTIAALRSKYGLHMRVERYVSDEGGVPEKDQKFIRK